MPAIKYYDVEQTRRVTVMANSANDAAQIATRVFELPPGHPSAKNIVVQGVWGSPVSDVEVTDLNVSGQI